MNQKEITTGIIGAGRWGKNLIREFEKVSTIKTIAYKNSPETKKWLSENYPNIQSTNSYEDILNDQSIDAVIVATPINTHYKITKEVLSSKKHVFVEKPLAETSKGSEELINIAKKNNLKLFVGFLYLYHDVFAGLLEIKNKEGISKLDFLWKKYGTFETNIIDNLVVHELAISITLLGELKNIQADTKSNDISKIDTLTFSSTFRDGTNCTYTIDRTSDKKEKSITITTQQGNTYKWKDDSLFSTNKNQKEKIVLTQNKTALERECLAFIQNLQNDKQEVDPYLALEVSVATEKLKRAIKE